MRRWTCTKIKDSLLSSNDIVTRALSPTTARAGTASNKFSPRAGGPRRVSFQGGGKVAARRGRKKREKKNR